MINKVTTRHWPWNRIIDPRFRGMIFTDIQNPEFEKEKTEQSTLVPLEVEKHFLTEVMLSSNFELISGCGKRIEHVDIETSCKWRETHIGTFQNPRRHFRRLALATRRHIMVFMVDLRTM